MYQCPCVHRYRAKYISRTKYLSKYFVNKVNFYSSLQDAFDKYSVVSYYPLASKGLWEDIFRGDQSYSKFQFAIKDLKKVYNKLEEDLTDIKVIPNRFEFLIRENSVRSLVGDLTMLLDRDSFVYIKKDIFKFNVLSNFETMLNILVNLSKCLINVGNIVLLETIIVCGFLRGDIFRMPFTAVGVRELIKNLWRYTYDRYDANLFKEIMDHDDNLTALDNLSKL